MSKSKKIFKIVSKFILVFILLIAAYWVYSNVISVDRESDPNAKTDTSPAVYETAEGLIVNLHEYEALENAMLETSSQTKKSDYGTYVIPGLNCMKTLNLYTKEVDSCGDMTPQGLAVTNDYLIFTAYCHRGEHNSVIVLIDKTTGKMVKEIPLEGHPHVGGIAYDPEFDRIWVSGKKDGKASAIKLTMESIVSYDSEKMDGPIAYESEEILPELKANSFMTYHERVLYAGYFTLQGKGIIERYLIGDDGNILHPETDESTIGQWVQKFLNPSAMEQFARIMPMIQGISFVNDQLLMTQSYGMGNSKLLISDETDLIQGQNNLTGKHMICEFSFPSYLESVCYFEKDGKVYFLFEGAAKAYRGKASVPMDRIISIDSDWYLKEE